MAKSKLENIIEPVVEAMGYEVVRVLLTGNVRQTLQVMIDIKDGLRPVTVDDCATVSRKLSKILDEKDPIANEYALEVSSPGIDRPLTKVQHYNRFKDNEVKIETIDAVDGRKRIKGMLRGADVSNNVHVDMDGKEYVIAFDNILKAKLVLTDELIEKYQQEQDVTTQI
jgi:ribosome maturation factor RimP